jgi:thymidylate kinase
MQSASLIIFSGTDGAGKSTQIHLLERTLHEKGVRTVRIWSRGGYTPLFSFLKGSARRLRKGRLPPPGPSSDRSRQFQNPRIRKLWLYLAVSDLLLYYVFWLRWLRLRGRTVICDRYLEDTLLDFLHNFPEEKVPSWWFWRLLCKLSPVPDVRFLLLVPPEISTERGKQKNEPFPDSPETLSWRFEKYRQLAASGDWTVLDGLESVDAVHQKILARLDLCE